MVSIYIDDKLTWNNYIDAIANKFKPPMSSAYYKVILKLHCTSETSLLYYYAWLILQHGQPTTLHEILPNFRKYNDSCMLHYSSVIHKLTINALGWPTLEYHRFYKILYGHICMYTSLQTTYISYTNFYNSYHLRVCMTNESNCNLQKLIMSTRTPFLLESLSYETIYFVKQSITQLSTQRIYS